MTHLIMLLGLFQDSVLIRNPMLYYTRNTLNDAQLNYTITKKEFLVVIFGFEKFRAYLIGSHVIVYTNHSVLKHLLPEKVAKPRLVR